MSFDFLAFKCLRHLTVENVCWDADHITALGTLRITLAELAVRRCDLTRDGNLGVVVIVKSWVNKQAGF